MSKETFIHRFPTGMVATLIVLVAPWGVVSVCCHWSKKRTPKRFRPIQAEYQIWRDASLLAVCQKHGLGKALLFG